MALKGTLFLLARQAGYDLVAEYRFAPPRRWRFDYALIEQKIAIEVEGGIWTAGRHNRPMGFLKDMEKYNEASSLGWKIFRTTPGNETDVWPYVERALLIGTER